MLKRFLVPTDLSPNALAGLEYAANLASRFDSEVVALFVLEPVTYAAMSTVYGAGAQWATLFKEEEIYARRELARLEKTWKRRIPKLRTLMQTGTAAATIVGTAAKLKADLIVMGTHGRSGLSRVLVGSVAERVVRTAPCPVLTVRPAKLTMPRVAMRRNAPPRSKRTRATQMKARATA